MCSPNGPSPKARVNKHTTPPVPGTKFWGQGEVQEFRQPRKTDPRDRLRGQGNIPGEASPGNSLWRLSPGHCRGGRSRGYQSGRTGSARSAAVDSQGPISRHLHIWNCNEIRLAISRQVRRSNPHWPNLCRAPQNLYRWLKRPKGWPHLRCPLHSFQKYPNC